MDGSQLYKLPWAEPFLEATDAGFTPSPSAARISIEQQVMAIIYRSKPIQIWSLEDHRQIGACIRPSTNKHGHANHIAHCVVFSPSSTTPRLLVSYWDDVLVTFDSITCKPLAWISAGLDKIAIAPNGKTVAGSDATGSIEIFDFETLQFLHRIQVRGDPVTSLAFTSDNIRIIDTRSTQINVWEPLVLIGQDTDSHSSDPSDSVHQVIDDLDTDSIVDQSTAITSLHCCEQTGMAFCGRNDGRDDICNLDDPEKTMRNLYKHRGTFTSVTCIDWSHKPRITASADSSGSFRIMKITTGARREWSAELLIEASLEQGCPISQVLVHPDGSFVLVSPSESDSVWSIANKERIGSLKDRKRTAWKWFIRPSTPSQLLLFEDKVLTLFNWIDLTQIAASEDPFPPLDLEGRPLTESLVDADAISISSEGDDLVFVQKLHSAPRALPMLPSSTTKIHVFDLSTLSHYPIQATSPSSTTSIPDVSSSQPTCFAHSTSFPPYLTNPFSTHTPLTSPPSSLLTNHGRSSGRNVADLPDVECIVGTVTKFSW